MCKFDDIACDEEQRRFDYIRDRLMMLISTEDVQIIRTSTIFSRPTGRLAIQWSQGEGLVIYDVEAEKEVRHGRKYFSRNSRTLKPKIRAP